MMPEEKIGRSFNLNYTSRRSSNSDTVADIAASFSNPGSDVAICQRISTWLDAIFSLPHHMGSSSEPFSQFAPISGERINTNFSLSSSTQHNSNGETIFDISITFENPIDRNSIYERINVWLKAAGIIMEYPTKKSEAGPDL